MRRTQCARHAASDAASFAVQMDSNGRIVVDPSARAATDAAAALPSSADPSRPRHASRRKSGGVEPGGAAGTGNALTASSSGGMRPGSGIPAGAGTTVAAYVGPGAPSRSVPVNAATDDDLSTHSGYCGCFGRRGRKPKKS